MHKVGVLLAVTLIAAWSLSVRAQSVISTRSGVINFLEGPVFLNNQPLEARVGRFPVMPLVAELRTGAGGHVEVLLTPGVFIRLDGLSSVRMVANHLADTQVELDTGSVIVDSAEPSPGTSVTLLYKDWWIHFLQKGTYRIDTNPPQLRVTAGYAEVMDGPNGEPVSVEAGNDLQFSDALAPEKSEAEASDALDDWSNGRNQSVATDNAITEHIGEDPATSQSPNADGFTYFPFLGVPLGLSTLNRYSSIGLYQPGFRSIYLPGYTYQPASLGVLFYGFPVFLTPRPLHPGISPVSPIHTVPAPHPPVSHPSPIRAPARGVRPLH